MALARKITRSKWDGDPFHDGSIPADAVSTDLRTRDNALSFWKCDDDTEVEDVALALASNASSLEKMDVALVEDAAIEKAGLDVSQIAGESKVTDLNRRHVDVTRLNLDRLAETARIVDQAVRDDRVRRFRRQELLALLAAAVTAERLQLDDLAGSVRSRVEQELRRSGGD